jgi:hypothetical protein
LVIVGTPWLALPERVSAHHRGVNPKVKRFSDNGGKSDVLSHVRPGGCPTESVTLAFVYDCQKKLPERKRQKSSNDGHF